MAAQQLQLPACAEDVIRSVLAATPTATHLLPWMSPLTATMPHVEPLHPLTLWEVPTPARSQKCSSRSHVPTPARSKRCNVQSHVPTPVRSQTCSNRSHVPTRARSQTCSARSHVPTPALSQTCMARSHTCSPKDKGTCTLPANLDWLHQNVQYLLRAHDNIASAHSVVRHATGVYDIDGHRVGIEWQSASEPGSRGRIVVVDGPLRQPLLNYLEMTETNAEYDTQVISKMSSLHHVREEQRVTFDDTHKKYTRLEAMQVAKEQAKVREIAADFTKEGMEIPGYLIKRYSKELRHKLRTANKLGLSPRQPGYSERDLLIMQRCGLNNTFSGTLPYTPPLSARPSRCISGLGAHGTFPPLPMSALPLGLQVQGGAALPPVQPGFTPRGPCIAPEVAAARAMYFHCFQ